MINAGMHFSSQFTIVMLKDPKYYGLNIKFLAEELGNMNMYIDLTTLFFRPFLGIVIDIYGRKWPIFIAIALCGISFTVYPNLKHLYPWFFLTRVTTYIIYI